MSFFLILGHGKRLNCCRGNGYSNCFFSVVVHPKYRTIGASVKLLRDSLPLCGKTNVEMIAVMARYNPFAEHAGTTKVCASKTDKSILEAIVKLEKLGFISYLLSVP